MLALNVKLTLLALIPMPIIALFTLRAGKMLHSRFEKRAGDVLEPDRARAREHLRHPRRQGLLSGGARAPESLRPSEGVRPREHPAGPGVGRVLPVHHDAVEHERRHHHLLRRQAGDAGRHHDRRPRGVHELPGYPDLADDSDGLGRQRDPARRGLDGAHQQDPRGRPRDRRPRRRGRTRGRAGRGGVPRTSRSLTKRGSSPRSWTSASPSLRVTHSA